MGVRFGLSFIDSLADMLWVGVEVTLMTGLAKRGVTKGVFWMLIALPLFSLWFRVFVGKVKGSCLWLSL